MKSQIKKDEFKELHKHKGSDNYEVVELFDKKMEINDKILVDKKNGNLFPQASQEDQLNEQEILKTKRISNLGDKLDNLNDYYRILNDGTQWSSRVYSNWIINGDATELKYLDPFSNKEIDNPFKFTAKEKDPEKWLQKFKELYAKAQYIYINQDLYYFKINNKWYYIKTYKMGNANDINIKKLYPPKEDQDIRMVALDDLSPKYFIAPNERDTQLIREMEYESTEYEEIDKGLISYGYSAGWWYLEVYMPLGDVIKIKRFSSFKNPDLQLYSIPNAYGGRQDVLFIVQESNPMHASQVAGMYVIRPKDPEQPQRRYSLIIYKRDKDGFKFIDTEKSVETEEYKAWVKKKKR